MADTELEATPLADYELADRYRATDGTVFLTGIQALSRIAIDQLRADRAAGRNTAAFLSGYPGSPLAGLDQEIPRAIATAGEKLPIEHVPAVNEELGVTAVMGSQLAATRPDCRYDGIVGLWYGKAPGLDRATDALRHAVFTGTSAVGGAVAIVGDDPSAKSSTMPSSSDAALGDLHMPVLYPADPAECLELGLHAVAISRATGLWSALKVVTAVADGNASVTLPAERAEPVMPLIELDGERWHPTPNASLLGPRMVEVERQFHEIRTAAALEYGQLNALNRVETDPSDAWLGIVATGFTFAQLIEAFRRLGFPSLQAIEEAGIRLLNLRFPIPFDRELTRRFATGLQEILVVEEKNPTLERLVRDALYTAADRPVVVGKFDEADERLLPSHGQLDADAIAPALRSRLEERLGAGRLAQPPPTARPRIPLTVTRAPYFCSGCPHNWGMKTPEDALVGMGTGCHGMGQLMDAERVGDSIGVTAMGNEGVPWLGMAPFVDTPHFTQNLGDGTYFHSGQLAIQAAIGAGATMTFKLLYNHTVAMTGGQEASLRIGPAAIASTLLLHGVKRVAITTDDRASYRGVSLPIGVTVTDRDRIVEVQEELAAIEGVTVLIHDQDCAAEQRRGRRRGTVDTPRTRILINHRVCEGCGDCGDVSGCLSVQPFDTTFGRKTTIDQASCNYDYSCIKGDCPAFLTVDVDDLATAHETFDVEPELPDLPTSAVVDGAVAVRLAGIGGTGVVTVAQILGTAATLSGRAVAGLDQTGLSQKAGPVVSDIIISAVGEPERSNLVGRAQADVLVAFDLMVGTGDGALGAVGPQTTVVASSHTTPTGTQVVEPSLSADPLETYLARLATTGAPFVVDAVAAARKLTGSDATANVLLLGAALQAGVLPVSAEAIDRAIELNGVAVVANRNAIRWGRACWEAPGHVAALLGGREPELGALELIERFSAELAAFQDSAYAKRFRRLVDQASSLGNEPLTLAVANGFYKLMAYKDEYEVARLLLSDVGLPLKDGAKPRWHLHPPMLKALGLNRKIALGPNTRPVLAALAKGKRLRGTKLDPFGRSELRRLERELIDEYEEALSAQLEAANPADLGALTELAALPDLVRGYEDLKQRRIAQYRDQFAALAATLGS